MDMVKFLGSGIFKIMTRIWDFPGGSDGKASCFQCGRPGFHPWVRKILWRRKWQPAPVLLPGKAHGQRTVVGYSPWGHKQSDTTERLHSIYLYMYVYIYTHTFMGFPGYSAGKESTCNAGDLGSIPGSGRSPGEGNGNPLQYSCLENSIDWGDW